MRYLALYDVEEGREDARVRRAVRRFVESGEAEVHSANGILLHHLCNHCVEASIPFELKWLPVERRYIVKRILMKLWLFTFVAPELRARLLSARVASRTKAAATGAVAAALGVPLADADGELVPGVIVAYAGEDTRIAEPQLVDLIAPDGERLMAQNLSSVP